MRRFALPLFLLVAGPSLAVAQNSYPRRAILEAPPLSETRRLALLPNETVGFRVLGTADQGRSLRVSTGHLREDRLYHAVARIIPRDGSPAMRVESTVSVDSPSITIGAIPAGAYTIFVHLEDYATGATRDARNYVVLR